MLNKTQRLNKCLKIHARDMLAKLPIRRFYLVSTQSTTLFTVFPNMFTISTITLSVLAYNTFSQKCIFNL